MTKVARVKLRIKSFKPEYLEWIQRHIPDPISQPPSWPPYFGKPMGCRVCGAGADGQVMGYVCPRGDCPSRVTCGSVTYSWPPGTTWTMN